MRRWRVNLRGCMFLLMAVYFMMLCVFYGSLQSESRHSCNGASCFRQWMTTAKTPLSMDVKRRVLETLHDNDNSVSHLFSSAKSMMEDRNLRFLNVSDYDQKHLFSPKEAVDLSCFLDARVWNRSFQALTPTDFIYSAYLDERYEKKVVRLMAVLYASTAKKSLNVICHFRTNDGTILPQTAAFYEMCENHGKLFGGFILSCEVPQAITDLCFINVTAEVKKDQSAEFSSDGTFQIQLHVTRLKSKSVGSHVLHKNVSGKEGFRLNRSYALPYNYTICVPPLFGKVSIDRLVEFIEMSRLLGFQHFLFYLADLEDTKIYEVLQYYGRIGVATTINWKLPDVITNSKIWYHAQLIAHNDCMYRAVSLTQHLAVIDIDELIVPHDGHEQLPDSLGSLFQENVAGLSFDSAFYDPKYAEGQTNSKLLIMKHNGRSSSFSKIRTKVLVKPAMVFEVGIHHVSKPGKEEYRVVKVNTSTAFLHHYRACMANYGMKCTSHIQDDTLLKFSDRLEANFAQVMDQSSKLPER